MALKELLLQLWAKDIPDIEPVVAAPTPLREAAGTTIDADEDQWRKLSGDAKRDLSPMTQARMQKMAHYLWEQNLLGNRLIELPVAYLLAEGVKLAVDDEENQKVLDRFWRDPINNMDLKLPKKVRELAVFGEQCYPAFVNEHDGMVRLGYLDPSLIETVVMDPDNREQPIGIVTVKDKRGKSLRFKIIICGPEEIFTERTQGIRASFTDGEAFYFSVNDLSSGTRGRSDLLAQADWLDAYDQFMFGELDRYGFLRAFIWDVELKGATPQEVEARAKKISTPKPGSVRVHNDSEEWSAETPGLQAADTSDGARMFRNHVLGGATMPESWFGGGGDVNRSTAAEMAEPTFKIYSMRQRYWKYILESIGRYVLYKSKIAEGAMDWSDEELDVRAEFPELVSKDTTKYASALAQVVTGCVQAIAATLMTREYAVKLIGAVAGRLGVEVDADEELANAQKQAADDAAADLITDPPAADDDGGAHAAAIQEAVDQVGATSEGLREMLGKVETQLREAARDAASEAARNDAKPDPVMHLADGIRELVEETSQAHARLIEALAGHTARQEIELTLKHGATEKTVTLPDGRSMVVKERDSE